MIIRAFAVIAALGILVSPAAAQSPAPAMPPLPKKIKAKYNCHNLTVPVTYDNVKHTAKIRYGGHDYTLPQAVSADGGRYMNDKLEWWSKGTGATLSSVTDGKVESLLATCQETSPKM